MERRNKNIPFEHQMLYIIRDYDKKVEEVTELRKEVEELSAALEQLGGKEALSSLKTKYHNLAQKHEELKGKLHSTECELKNKTIQVAALNAKIAKMIITISDYKNCIINVQTKLKQMLSLVEVPTLKKLLVSVDKAITKEK